MESYLLKIIQLFGYSSARILIISTNEPDFRICLANCPDKLISHINPAQNNALSLPKDHFRKEVYDLIILDRIWDKNDKIPENLPTFLNRKNLWELIKKSLAPNGQIICLAKNRLNLRTPAACMKSLFNFLLRGNISPFAGYYAERIKTAGCPYIKRFHLFPEPENFNHLISDDRRATLEFMRKSRGYTRAFPKKLKDWPKWLFVWLGVDGLLVSAHLFWGRK